MYTPYTCGREQHYWPEHYKHDPLCEECRNTVYERPLICRIGCYLQHSWFMRSSIPNRKLRYEYECNFCGSKMFLEKELRRQEMHPFCQLGLHEWETCDMGCCSPWCARGCQTKYDFSEGIKT